MDGLVPLLLPVAPHPWRVIGYSLFQPGESQIQSAMPDQENQVHSVKWTESLVWAQANVSELKRWFCLC